MPVTIKKFTKDVYEVADGGEVVGGIVKRTEWQFHATEQVFDAADLKAILRKIQSLTSTSRKSAKNDP